MAAATAVDADSLLASLAGASLRPLCGSPHGGWAAGGAPEFHLGVVSGAQPGNGTVSWQ